MKPKVAKLNPKNLKDLKAAILKVWDELDCELFRKLSSSFVNRALEVIERKGWHIDY